MMAERGRFEILGRDANSRARRGRLHTAHGAIDTPAFMPVGTQGTVKALSPRDLREQGVQIILSNTYHLAIRPGMDVIRAVGGLHAFAGWDGPILTDSGGYQVFSLARLRRVRDDGVEFNNHIDGGRLFLGPAEAMRIQRLLGSDVAMVLDVCPPYPCSFDYACQAVDNTLRWAAQCLEQPRAEGQQVFGIVQGGAFAELRVRCARALTRLPFDGYAIGGVSVGEPESVLIQSVADCVDELPEDKPRYLMGVGLRGQMIEAVARGVDFFDCVVPTRFARNGTAFTRAGAYPVKAARYREDPRPVEPGCACVACRGFSRAYIRHLLNMKEILGVHLLTMHNVHAYMRFMREMRAALDEGRFADNHADWTERTKRKDRGIR